MKIKGIIAWALLFVLSSLTSGCGGDGSTTEIIVEPPREETPTELRILVLGQSISSNCNERIYGLVSGVYQVALTGEIKAARDPFEWADCSNGSMWMPLGRKLIESGVAAKVVFMPIGVGATSVQDWQPGGRAFGKLENAIRVIHERGINFDLALWHQGYSDYGTAPSDYTNRLSGIVNYVNNNVKVGRWIIALHSRCYGRYDPNIELAQQQFANAPQFGRFVGPNTNLLGDEFRFDSCHLNSRGQEEMAALWLNSIQAALKSK